MPEKYRNSKPKANKATERKDDFVDANSTYFSAMAMSATCKQGSEGDPHHSQHSQPCGIAIMAAHTLPPGSQLDVFQKNEGRKIMTLKLSKDHFEEEELGVIEFMKVVVNVNQNNGIDLHELTVKSMYMTQVYKLYTCTSSVAEWLVKQVTLTILCFLLCASH